MKNRVNGFLRFEETDGKKAHEIEINGRAVFALAIDVEDEDLPEDQGKAQAVLCGSTSPAEFIERICDALPDAIKEMADDKIPAGVWYAKLVKEMARNIAEKIDDEDKTLMDVILKD